MNLPRKRFGQHFLQDKAVIERIVTVLAPKAADHLIEIGPGQGALTVPVMHEIDYLEAVELDRDLIPELQRRTERLGKLEIYSADVLDFDFAKVKNDHRLLRVFGNLPYNISTPLIFHLLDYTNIISDMIFMLQKEVAYRLAANVGDADYGRLSVMAQYHCEIDVLFDVSAQAFYPPPKVESSIVRLLPFRDQPPYVAKDYAQFAALVKLAFGQRRKTLRNSLKEMINNEKWETLKVLPTARPEELHVKDFVEIANALKI